MDKERALSSLIALTNTNLGYIPSTPAEFNDLSHKIKAKIGRTLSLSSIKRIWGYVNYGGFPSVTTLNTLAIYNGFKDWNRFLINTSDDPSAFDSGFFAETVIDPHSLNIGDKLKLRWGNNKSCEIECYESGRYIIKECNNIKLRAGDRFVADTLCVGHPICFHDLWRGDLNLISYIGAKRGGLTSITLIPLST